MIYLEAPAGVGYSYSDDKNYTTDDDQVGMLLFICKDLGPLFVPNCLCLLFYPLKYQPKTPF